MYLSFLLGLHQLHYLRNTYAFHATETRKERETETDIGIDEPAYSISQIQSDSIFTKHEELYENRD